MNYIAECEAFEINEFVNVGVSSRLSRFFGGRSQLELNVANFLWVDLNATDDAIKRWFRRGSIGFLPDGKPNVAANYEMIPLADPDIEVIGANVGAYGGKSNVRITIPDQHVRRNLLRRARAAGRSGSS